VGVYVAEKNEILTRFCRNGSFSVNKCRDNKDWHKGCVEQADFVLMIADVFVLTQLCLGICSNLSTATMKMPANVCVDLFGSR
jgi:hypothetical protein